MSGDSGDIYQYNAIYGARAKIRSMLADIRKQGYSKQQPFVIGRVEKRMIMYATNNNIPLASKSVYMTARAFTHARRGSKQKKGLVIADKDFLNFPINRRSMELYYDKLGKGDAFIYTDRKVKFILYPNYEMSIRTSRGKKKVVRVNIITTGKVTDPKEFDNKGKYDRV